MTTGLEKVFLQILNMSLMASYCIAAVFFLRWLFKKAPKRYTYLLWIVVAFRLLCPLSIESAFSVFNLDLIPEIAVEKFAEQSGAQSGADMNVPGDAAAQLGNAGDASVDQSGNQFHGQNGQSGVVDPELSNRPGESGNGAQNGVVNQSGGTNHSAYNDAVNQSGGANQGAHNGTVNQQGTGILGITGQPGDTSAGGVSAEDGSAGDSWTMIGSWLWIGGMSALAVLMVISWIRLKLHIRTAVKLRDNIYEADGIESPFVMGCFRTKIYLPVGLTAEQQELILLHENCHIRRGDHLFKLLATLLTIVYWFNPLVWVAWFGFCRDMEMSCDEMALEGADSDLRKAYSQTLLAVATQRPFSWQMPPAFGENNIKSRIKHVLSLKKPAVWVGGVFVVVLVAVWVIFGTNGRNEVPDETLSGIEQETKSEGLMAEDSETEDDETEFVPETLALYVEGLERKDGGRIIAAHDVDVDHDGQDEKLVLQYISAENAADGNTVLYLSVVNDGEEIWTSENLRIWNDRCEYACGMAYFLYSDNGQNFVVEYEVHSDDDFESRYRCFYFTEGNHQETVDIRSLRMIPYYTEKLDSSEVTGYFEQLNGILENSIVLLSNINGKFTYTSDKEPITYTENPDNLFTDQVDYTGCETIEEKVDALNVVLKEPGNLTMDAVAELGAHSASESGEDGTAEVEITEEPTDGQDSEEVVSARIFMLDGGIPFTVSELGRYSEEVILKAAEAALDELGDTVISVSYDESENETLIATFLQRGVLPDWYQLPEKETIVLSSQIIYPAKERLYQQYFYNRYSEILNVDASLKETVSSYLQARFSDYNELYAELAPRVTISDQAVKEGEAWMTAFREREKGVYNGFLHVESEPSIVSVTELNGNLLVAVKEWILIQYNKADVMGVGENHLLVFRPTGEGYELLHDYCLELYKDNELEGVEAYVSDELKEKITLLVYDEEQGQWKRDVQSIDREVSIDEMRGLVAAEMSRQAEELMKQKESWFADYNGEKLQITDKATYYRADQGETLAEIVKCMVDSWYAELPMEQGASTITDYFLDDDQPIYGRGDVIERAANFAWSWWQNEKDTYEGSLSDFVSQVMYLDTEQTRPIASEDMWLIPYLDIYTKYEGSSLISWESYVEYEGQFMKNGCMPQIRQGSGGMFHYILVRDGDVYCLQRATDMEDFRWAHNGSFWGEGVWSY